MRGVQPLAADRRVHPPGRGAAPRARFARAERAAVLARASRPPARHRTSSPAMNCSSAAPGVPETVLRRLRRGDYRIEAEIDLHGSMPPTARAQLREFLQSAHRAGHCAACASSTARACAPARAARC